MKVILLKFVKDLGRAGDIVEVSDGYAVNALFPKGLARQATAAILNKHKMAQKSAAIKAEKEKKAILEALQKIDGKVLFVKEKLNPKGKLYHSFGVREIIRVLHDQYHVSIPNHLFKKDYSFKEAGKYTVELEAYDTPVKIIVSIEEK